MQSLVREVLSTGAIALAMAACSDDKGTTATPSANDAQTRAALASDAFVWVSWLSGPSVHPLDKSIMPPSGSRGGAR